MEIEGLGVDKERDGLEIVHCHIGPGLHLPTSSYIEEQIMRSCEHRESNESNL